MKRFKTFLIMILYRIRPLFTKSNNPYIKKFMQVVGIKEASIVKYCTDGGTIIPQKKIPFIIFGPGDIAQAHQNDEYIELESLYKSVDTFLEFLKS